MSEQFHHSHRMKILEALLVSERLRQIFYYSDNTTCFELFMKIQAHCYTSGCFQQKHLVIVNQLQVGVFQRVSRKLRFLKPEPRSSISIFSKVCFVDLCRTCKRYDNIQF